MNVDQLLQLGKERQNSGDLVGARRLYQEVLAQDARHPVGLVRSGLLEMQQGDAEAAISLIQAAIAAKPEEANYHFILGEVFASVARWRDAAAAYQCCVRLNPERADVWFSLGNARQAVGDLAGAIESYESATRLQADFAEALGKIGACQQMLGNVAAAEFTYARVLSIRPDDGNAISNLGTLLQSRGELEQAVTLLSRAVELEPANAAYGINLGAALCQQRKFREAASTLQRVLNLAPDNADAAYNFANAIAGLGRPREALQYYIRAIKLRPNFADALNNLGNIHKEMGEFDRAADAYDAAIGAQPGFVVAMNNAGCLLRSMGKLEEAEAMLRRALKIDPNHSALHNNLGNVLKDTGQLDESIESFRKSLAIEPNNAEAHSNLAYALSFSCEEATPILAECRRWNAHHADPLRSHIPVHNIERLPGRRLRVGYVSPDFRDHCQSLFTIPLLSHHDHTQFEIFCYSNVERADEVTGRIRQYADHWHDIRAIEDAAVCDLMRADGIDILVDLTMHMAHGRPLVFARKPAPVQIAWLAYPGTTGMTAIDYRLSDPRLDPPGFENHYTEKTIRLPDSFWCYDPLTTETDVNPLPSLSRGHITFGCLNNPCKLTDHTLRMWAMVMGELPDSELILMAPPGRQRERLLERFAKHKLGSERISFRSYRPRGEYLRTYQEIDIGLDTFPYNGHTTSLDALWMGVPVVTRVGQTCVGRGGLSQLYQLDLLDLAGETDERFRAAAVGLARDLPRLAELRQSLRSRLERSALMDGGRFARNVEEVYRLVVRTQM